MSDLKQMIKNKLEDNKGLAEKIAEKAGFSNTSPLNKFINDPDREMENFNSLLIVIKELFGDREFELMSEYVMTLDPNKKAARYALEYAEVNNLGSLCDKLVDKLSNAKNATSKEWATVYSVRRKCETNKLNVTEVMDLLSECAIKSPELKIFTKIILLYKYMNDKLFDVMYDVLSTFDFDAINQITNEFIQKSYLCRAMLLKTSLYVRRNEIEEARECALTARDNSVSTRFDVFSRLQLGNTYILENYEKAEAFYNDGLNYIGSNKGYRKQLERSMSFLCNYWSKTPETLSHESADIEDIHEIAFNMIKQGQREEARDLLNSLDIENMKSNQKAFHYFYRGLMDNSKEMYYKSVENFKLSGDKYFRQISLIELKKLGEHEMVLHALSI